jgi:hypothetical protein
MDLKGSNLGEWDFVLQNVQLTGWSNLDNEELRDLYLSSNIIIMMISRRI